MIIALIRNCKYQIYLINHVSKNGTMIDLQGDFLIARNKRRDIYDALNEAQNWYNPKVFLGDFVFKIYMHNI